MRFNYSELAKRMTREEMIVLQLRKQAQEAIDRAYADGLKKVEAIWR